VSLGWHRVQEWLKQQQSLPAYKIEISWIEWWPFALTQQVSNTGVNSGTSTIIQKKLERRVLSLACRHHVMELILGAAYEVTISGCSGPVVQLFKRFKEKWQFIDIANFQSASTDPSVEAFVAIERDSIVKFALKNLQERQPRDDYRKFLEFAVIFLGGTPARGVRFQAPGAMHHAKWMGKALYAIKMWLFRDQFKLSKWKSEASETWQHSPS